MVGTAAFALQECSKPDIKIPKSALMVSKLRIGDVDTRPEEAVELRVRTSKCTAASKAPSMKRFARRENLANAMEIDGQDVYTALDRKTRFFVERGDGRPDPDNEVQMDDEDEAHDGNEGEAVEKEDLVRGYKYGASFVPLDDEGLERLEPNSGIDICGFFFSKNVKFFFFWLRQALH